MFRAAKASTTVASRKRVLPARSAVICTRALEQEWRAEKNRANRSAHYPCSFAVQALLRWIVSRARASHPAAVLSY